MDKRLLLLSAICLLAFGQRATAVTEIFRVWQEFDVRAVASGYYITDDGVNGVSDSKQSAFAATIAGAQRAAHNSSAPFSGANAGILVWGWRTNISGSTYDFSADFYGAVSQSAPSDSAGPAGAQASVHYAQIYEFSVSTITGATERVTIDVSHFDFNSNPNGGVSLTPLEVYLNSISGPSFGYYRAFTAPGSRWFDLPDGDYRMEIRLSSSASLPNWRHVATGFGGSWTNSVRFSNLTPFPGWSFDFPIIKNPVSCRYCYDFRQITKGTWVGAQAANEFSQGKRIKQDEGCAILALYF